MNQNQKGSAGIVIISIAALIVIAVCGIYWWQNAEPENANIVQGGVGDYQWSDEALKSQYSNVLWNKINTNNFAGLSPSVSLTEKKTDFPNVCANPDVDNYIRIEGGLCGVGFWFEDPSGNKIDSREKLTALFAPIESEAEAVSFFAITQGGLKADVNGVLEGNTAVIDDGFLIQLSYVNAFGCGDHKSTGVVFKVLRNGEFRQIAAEKQESPEPGDSTICID